MKERSGFKNVLRITGAFIIWVMGSGFATGQELLQFFSSYGYFSYGVLFICLIGFTLIGTEFLKTGYDHRLEEDFRQTEYFCGKYLGGFYGWFIPFSMFFGMIIFISGAGATLHEYYGLSHAVGAVVLVAASYIAYVAGFQRFISAASFIGPVMILFVIAVGIISVIRGWGNLGQIGELSCLLEPSRPAGFFWLSALLYVGYNFADGSFYYVELGSTAAKRKEAVLAGILASTGLILAIFVINTAILTDIKGAGQADIPTLFLAGNISYLLGAAFSIILILSLFCSCSAMLWTVSSRFTKQGTLKSNLFAAGVSIVVLVAGMLPFSDLVGIIYPYLGYISLPYVACMLVSMAGRMLKR